MSNDRKQRLAIIRAKIDEAEDDPRPLLTDAEVERHFAERLQEAPEEIAAIRVKLLEAEKSGFTDQTVDQIWQSARM